MKNCGGLSQGLVATAAGLSISMARCLSADELAVLGAFFTVLGDNLALLAIQEADSAPCGNSTDGRAAQNPGSTPPLALV